MAIVRWFIEEWWKNGSSKSDAPLSQLLAVYEAAGSPALPKRLEEIQIGDRQHTHYLVGNFTRLAWAIRALHGGPTGSKEDACEWVDASFVADELLGEDSKEKDPRLRKLPAGVGTLVLAGRLVQAGRGRVRVSGNKKQGHDIRWITGDGDLVLLERKDRSYDAGLRDTPKARMKRVVDEVQRAKLPAEPGAVRIFSVGFSHLVTDRDAEVVDPAYQHAMETECGDLSSGSPHFVLVEHLGFEPRTAGAKIDFFSPQALVDITPGPMARVARLLLRACGQPV